MDFKAIESLHHFLDTHSIDHIPLGENKTPLISGYKLGLGKDLPASKEFFSNVWEHQEVYGIGLVLGVKNNLVAIDFDTEDPKLNEELTPLIKDFKHIRIGNPKRLGAVLCKYEDAFSRKGVVVLGKEKIEILSTGQYLAIEDSWHNGIGDTYKFKGRSIKEEILDLSEMPIDLRNYISSRVKFPTGKNFKAGKPAWECGKSPFQRFVNSNFSNEVIMDFNPYYKKMDCGRYETLDSKSKNPGGNITPDGFFITSHGVDSDPIILQEGKRNFTPFEVIRCYINPNVESFVKENFPVIWKKWETHETSPQTEFSDDNEEDLSEEEDDEKFFEEEEPEIETIPTPLTAKDTFETFLGNAALPQFCGFFKDTMDLHCNAVYPSKILPLISSLGVFGTLCSNLYSMEHSDLTANITSMISFESGSGKSEGAKIYKHITEVFPDAIDLFYDNTSESTASFIEPLEIRPRGLCVWDECSSFLKGISTDSGKYHDLDTELNKIWEHKGVYGRSTRTQNSYGVCFSPRISFQGMTTDTAFLNTFPFAKYFEGFGRRFFILHEKKREKKRISPGENLLKTAEFDNLRGFLGNAIKQAIANQISKSVPFQRFKKGHKKGETLYWSVALSIDTAKAKIPFFQENKDEFLKIENRIRRGAPGFMDLKLGSFYHQVEKIAMILEFADAARKTTLPKTLIVSQESFEKAEQVVRYLFASEYNFMVRALKLDKGLKTEKLPQFIKAWEKMKISFALCKKEGKRAIVKNMNPFRFYCKKEKLNPYDLLKRWEKEEKISLVETTYNRKTVFEVTEVFK